jgi:hypothetical protein
MKKKGIFLIGLLSILSVNAQEAEQPASNWKKGGDFTVNFSQVSFSNWSAGGKNSVSGVSVLNYSANYAKDRQNCDNGLNLGYGLMKEGTNELVKP